MITAENANIKVLRGHDALTTLRTDFEYGGDVYAWMYLIERGWVTEMMAQRPVASRTSMIVDQKSVKQAAWLQQHRTNFMVWAWSYNRTMHDKTYVFPQRGITYIGTHNLTRGSYTLSQNRTVRIENAALAEAMMTQWKQDRARARKISNVEGKEKGQK